MYVLNYRPLIEELLEQCVDLETGEVLDEELLERVSQLEMEESEKIENIALEYKESGYMIDALDQEIKALQERRRSLVQKNEKISSVLGALLDYGKFETSRVKLSFRKSSSVEIVNEEAIPSEYKRETAYIKLSDVPAELRDKIEKTDTSISKMDIKKAIKEGIQVFGACIKEKKNLVVK